MCDTQSCGDGTGTHTVWAGLREGSAARPGREGACGSVTRAPGQGAQAGPAPRGQTRESFVGSVTGSTSGREGGQQGG